MNMRQVDTVNHFYEQFIQHFLDWAQTQEPIRAVIQLGSRARQNNPADVWADLDLMLYMTTPEAYAQRTDWIHALAPVWLMVPWHTANNEPEQLVVFENGYFVDFVFCSVASLDWLRHHVHEDRAFQRGARILLDRDGLAAQIPLEMLNLPARQPPTSEQFFFVCHAFWYLCTYIARQIQRGDLWLVKVRDAQLKELLLRMLEWHTGTIRGWQYDTWHDGRFIDQWADKRAIAEIQHIFGQYDGASAQKALWASFSLFCWLAQETAGNLRFQYPHHTQKQITTLMHEALDN